MVNRINLILQAKNITARAFAEEIGAQPSSLSHILSGRNNPSLDFVMKIIRRYPEININWLMFGKGEMYDNAQQSNVPQMANPPEESVNQSTSMGAAIPANSNNQVEEAAVALSKAEAHVPNSSVEPPLNMEYDLFSQPEIPVANGKSEFGSQNLVLENSVAGGELLNNGVSERVDLPEVRPAETNAVASAPGVYGIEGRQRQGAQPGAEDDRGVTEQVHAVSNIPATQENVKNGTPNPAILDHPTFRREPGKQIVKVIVFYSDNTFSEL